MAVTAPKSMPLTASLVLLIAFVLFNAIMLLLMLVLSAEAGIVGAVVNILIPEANDAFKVADCPGNNAEILFL